MEYAIAVMTDPFAHQESRGEERRGEERRGERGEEREERRERRGEERRAGFCCARENITSAVSSEFSH